MRNATYTDLGALPVGPLATAQTVAAMARLAAGAFGGQSPTVREIAVALIRDTAGKDRPAEVAAVLAGWMARVQYRADPISVERLQVPVVTWRDRAGDCDDFSTAIAATLGTIGYRTRFVTGGMVPGAWSHVWLQVWLGGAWVDLDGCRPAGPEVGWRAPFPVVTPWPENTPSGFDPQTALDERYESQGDAGHAFATTADDPTVTLGGLGDAAALPELSKAALGPLPNPADWYRKNPNGPFTGSAVPGWDAATSAQRGPFLKALLTLTKQTGEEQSAYLAKLDTLYRVTTAVATLGASEVIKAWEDLVAQAHEYRELRKVKLARISELSAIGTTAAKKSAADLTAALAKADALVREKMGILAPLLKGEAGLGILPSLILGMSAPVALALIAVVAAAIALALKQVAAVVENVSEAFGGAPWLLIAAGGGAAWYLYRRHKATAKPAAPQGRAKARSAVYRAARLALV
jgi:hypothetical protein